jgi:hypothetical protein
MCCIANQTYSRQQQQHTGSQGSSAVLTGNIHQISLDSKPF